MYVNNLIWIWKKEKHLTPEVHSGVVNVIMENIKFPTGNAKKLKKEITQQIQD